MISLADGQNNQVVLGNSYVGNYAAYIVAGNYNSQYTFSQGGNLVPVNNGNNIATALPLMNDQVLDIDVPAYSVKFTFTLNGVSFPASEYDDAVFYLQRDDGGERILLGNSHAAIDPVWLMPGTYDVIYQVETPGAMVPLNQNAIVDTVVIDNTTSVVVIDITTVSFRLDVTLDNAAFPVSQYEDGDFLLLNADGDRAELGATYELPLIVNVIEGTYDIVYAHETGTSVPLNSEASIAGNQLINAANADTNLNIQSALITPQITHNGNAFPVSEYQDANIYLRGTGNNNDQILLTNTHTDSPPAIKIIRGTYNVIYQHETGDQVPQNTNAVVAENVVLNADQALPVDIASVDITGTFTLNGNNFTSSQFQVAEFHFRGTAPGDEFLLGYSNDGEGTAKIISGTYDIVYKHTDGNDIPRNPQNTITNGLLLDTSQSIRINVLATFLSPVFTLNNQAFPEDSNDYAQFYLHGETADDRIFIGKSYVMQNVSALVVNDSYDVMYEYIKGGNIPINAQTRVATIDVP
ncbi:MAG: hypothetical protein PVF06_09010 [Gammaproteobacteria bacterium]